MRGNIEMDHDTLGNKKIRTLSVAVRREERFGLEAQSQPTTSQFSPGTWSTVHGVGPVQPHLHALIGGGSTSRQKESSMI